MMYNPPHPGEVLKTLYLEPLDLSISQAAKDLGMTRAALSEIINGRRKITPKVAIKLAKAFGGNAQVWVKQQATYDLWQEQQTYQAEEITPIYCA